MALGSVARRTAVVSVIAVVACGVYFAAIESTPAEIRTYLKALPLIWIVPGVLCSALFLIVWRNSPNPPSRIYLRTVGYGFAAPPVALALIAFIYAFVLGHNP
jgi:hypothetical protein